ncbi:MAG TPA: SEC-C metal-binding domain-containing protein, partial [Clostridia bacterium]|nr:SEC-C metal-binding domain-containing protein [Clostridia bacterium]
VIPTHKPMIRNDRSDVIYKTEEAKLSAVVDEIERRNKTGQPVLVGTISIEKSELLSKMLKRKGLKHQVLNAKFHDKEAEIVAQAGRLQAITIATNMAGRGTDILLGGNPGFLAEPELHRLDKNNNAGVENEKRAILERYKKVCEQEREDVVTLGGLHIIGTERHESRRIDNQLRGRCGRQGDPGSTQFFVSLEDDLMRLFGSDNISGIMERLGMEDDVPIEHNLISKSIETAQKKVENRNFNIRKHVLEYDDVLNQQRELIYDQRRRVLTGEDMKEHILEMVKETVNDAVETYAPEGVYPEEWDLKGLLLHAGKLFIPEHTLKTEEFVDLSREQVGELLLEHALEAYENREQELGEETLREVERMLLLRIVDQKWMEHLDAMDQLREGIGLRAYGQKDPLVEYKFEGYEMFQNMIEAIQEDVVRLIYRVNVVTQPQAKRHNVTEGHNSASAFSNAGGGSAGKPKPVQRRHKKIGRNAPCPCGSGKKYKKCCGAN